MAGAGLFRYSPTMAEDPEMVDELLAAEQAFDAYGKLPLLTDVESRITEDLTSGKGLWELPAWEGVE